MFSRGIALSSIFALATVAQGGVQVQLVPIFCPGGGTCVAGLCSGGTRNGLCCAPTQYAPSSVVQVDVKLAQLPGGSDQLLRMVEFDMLTSSSSLAVVLPLIHDKPGTIDDINFWSFSSLAGCNPPTSSFCGFKHFIDYNTLAGPVDTRLKMLSIAYNGLSANGSDQIALLANGAPVTVGKLQVTVSASPGSYTLNLMNAADAGADRGARVDFGFDPHMIWQARYDNARCTSAGLPNECCTGAGTGTCTNFVSGGTLTFSVGASTTCAAAPGPSVLTWESMLTHTRSGQTPIDVPLDIFDNVRCTGAGVPYACCTGAGTGTCTGLFSEPRSGVKKIIVTFDGAINPATAIPANVTVCGNNVANSPVDLSGVGITTATTNGDTKMEINFTPGLPDFARYRIVLKTSILGSGGGAIQAGTGGLSRILTALQGDAGGAAGGGDRRTNSTDVGLARGLATQGVDPIDPLVLNHVRSDVNNDKRINSTDVSLIRARAALGNDARTIADPVCP